MHRDVSSKHSIEGSHWLLKPSHLVPIGRAVLGFKPFIALTHSRNLETANIMQP